MILRTPIRPAVVLSLLLVVAPVVAQDPRPEVVIPPENVRYDYAQVLGVKPIFQVLRTSAVERVCDLNEADQSKLSRVVSSMKGRLGGNATPEERKAGLSNCRMEPVAREFRRPIAYDVDYVYKGSKFRTRMARDPGNRLRVRVSITPHPHD